MTLSSERVESEQKEVIVCNYCGQSCYDEGLLEASVWGGDQAKYLEDMTRYSFSLCGVCLLDLFDKFKIPVEIKEYSFA